MAKDHSEEQISAFDCDILCSAFQKSVAENRIDESKWRAHAMLLAREFTGHVHVEPDVLDRIVRK